jgi:membrane protease YdiL (CAAX protease family)
MSLTTTLTGYAKSVLKIILLLVVAVVVASIVDMGILAVVWAYFAATTGSAAQASDMVVDSLRNIWLMFGLTSAQDITWVLLAVAFVIFIDRRPSPLKELGLTPGPQAVKMFLAGIVINVLFGAVTVAIMLLTGWSRIEENGLLIYGLAAIAGSLAITIVLMFFVGLGEETLFRGYFQTDLTRKHGPVAALIITSLALQAASSFSFRAEISPLSITASFASLVMGTCTHHGTIWASVNHFCQTSSGRRSSHGRAALRCAPPF